MNRILKEILSTSLYILAVLLGTYFLVHFVIQRTEVQGSSMEPTLHDGDQLFVEKVSYRFSEPKRFDIVVFPFHYGEKVYYIKRIIGLPGETVKIDDTGLIWIDGEILYETYGKEVIKDPGLARDTIKLGPDEYFVLGDNRNDSSDSRVQSVGNIKRDELIGKAWVRLWPFSEFGFVSHR